MNEIQSIGHFLKTSKGYRVTAPEGFVADRSMLTFEFAKTTPSTSTAAAPRY